MTAMTRTLALLGALTVLWGCDVDKTEEGSMPDVDVDAEAGNMPEYEVEQTEEGEMPDIDVDAEAGEMPEYDVEGPDVDVETVEKTVEVPVVDVEMPDDAEAEAEEERDQEVREALNEEGRD